MRSDDKWYLAIGGAAVLMVAVCGGYVLGSSKFEGQAGTRTTEATPPRSCEAFLRARPEDQRRLGQAALLELQEEDVPAQPSSGPPLDLTPAVSNYCSEDPSRSLDIAIGVLRTMSPALRIVAERVETQH